MMIKNNMHDTASVTKKSIPYIPHKEAVEAMGLKSMSQYAGFPIVQYGPIFPPDPYQNIEKNIERENSMMVNIPARTGGMRIGGSFFVYFSEKKPDNPQNNEVMRTEEPKAKEIIIRAASRLSSPRELKG